MTKAISIQCTAVSKQTGGVYVTGEAIRGLADLEAKERERCADFSGKAVAAGLMKRRVGLAELQGEMLAKALSALPAVLQRVGLSQDQMRRVREELRVIDVVSTE